MSDMKRLALVLLFVASSAAGAAPGGDRLAPPVVRKPAVATNAPAEPSPEPSNAAPPAAACGGAGGVPCGPKRDAPASEDAYFGALAASAGTGSDPILDKGLMRTMSRLMAANRCNDAVALATQNGRAALAGRAKQLCQAN
jgi:hypothetical protein